MSKLHFIFSVCVSAAVSVIYLIIITIAQELYTVLGAGSATIKPIKVFLEGTFGHHWVGKGTTAVIIFIVVSGIIYLITIKNSATPSLKRAVSSVAYATMLGAIILYSFFVYESFFAGH